jgi:5-methylcytosine-specific restriction endonuclease McrA
MRRIQQKDRRRRYEWSSIQRYYDEGHSFRECMQRFGFSAAAWDKAVKRGEIRPRPAGRPIIELLDVGGSRTHIKQRLLRAGLLHNRCSQCGITEWLGEPLTIQIDHINGVHDDFRLENLRMLCPNCHSQTDTYGNRNGKRYRRLQDPGPVL